MTHWLRRCVEVVGDWIFLIRRDGWKSSRSRIVKELGHLPYRKMHYLVLARSLADSIPEFPVKRAIAIRSFTKDDLEFVRREYLPSEANLCQRRLSKGQLGFVASVDGQTAGYCWLAKNDALERVRLFTEPGDILAPNAFTAPVFRNIGIKTALAIECLCLARESGYGRIITYIESDNRPSRKIWQNKLGAKIIGRFVFQRIGFFRMIRYQ